MWPVARVLKYVPFVPTQSSHLARLAHKVFANAQQLADSRTEGRPGAAPLVVRSEMVSSENISAVNPTSPSAIVSNVSVVPPPRP
jgi:hypothetical protein